MWSTGCHCGPVRSYCPELLERHDAMALDGAICIPDKPVLRLLVNRFIEANTTTALPMDPIATARKLGQKPRLGGEVVGPFRMLGGCPRAAAGISI